MSYKRGGLLEDVFIEKLIFGGRGLALTPDGKKIIVTGGAIPESIVDLRILKNRKNYLEAQILTVKNRSPIEQELPEHFQVYGGCKWLPIPYEKQLEIKGAQVREAFHHSNLVLGIRNLESEEMPSTKYQVPNFHSIVPSPEVHAYRNKVEFSWGKYISAKEDVHDEYRFGFHAQGSFDRIIDCSFCVLADDVVNDIFRLFDAWARESGLPTYDQKRQEGFWRHLVVRRGITTHQTMVVLSVNSEFSRIGSLKFEIGNFVDDFVAFLKGLDHEVTSAYLLHNSGKADIVDGEFEHVYGKEVIVERLIVGERGLDFQIRPKSFFQTNTLGAQKLYEVVRGMICERDGVILDLYAGTGTIGIIVSDLAKKVYSVELVQSASEDNRKNLELNGIKNVVVVNGKVEDFLKNSKFKIQNEEVTQFGTLNSELGTLNLERSVDTIIIDPPRAGMHPSAPEIISQFEAKEIIYVSCNPSTLVRDLEVICQDGEYFVTDITPVDMFPHTHHIETVVRLARSDFSQD